MSFFVMEIWCLGCFRKVSPPDFFSGRSFWAQKNLHNNVVWFWTKNPGARKQPKGWAKLSSQERSSLFSRPRSSAFLETDSEKSFWAELWKPIVFWFNCQFFFLVGQFDTFKMSFSGQFELTSYQTHSSSSSIMEICRYADARRFSGFSDLFRLGWILQHALFATDRLHHLETQGSLLGTKKPGSSRRFLPEVPRVMGASFRQQTVWVDGLAVSTHTFSTPNEVLKIRPNKKNTQTHTSKQCGDDVFVLDLFVLKNWPVVTGDTEFCVGIDDEILTWLIADSQFPKEQHLLSRWIFQLLAMYT